LHEELVKEISTMPRTPTQEDFMATARKGQELMVDAIRTWVETVRTATPKLSSVYAQYAERLPKVPSPYAPLASQLPKAEKAVASAYDLAERWLASQRKFAEDVVKATKPLMPGFGASQPEEHSETAPQATAAKSVAQEPVAEKEQAPKVAAPKSTTKTTAAARTPRSTAASRAPRSTAAKRTPKNSDAG
jgi:hypothetical protein